MDELVFVRGGDFEQAIDDVVGGDAVALGGEIHDEAMAKHRLGQCADIFERDVRPAVDESAGLCAEDQELRGTRAGAPGQLIAGEIGGAFFANARLPHERERVANQVVADRHGAHEILKLREFHRARGQPRLARRAVLVVRRATSNSSLKLGYVTSTLNMKRSCCASGSG